MTTETIFEQIDQGFSPAKEFQRAKKKSVQSYVQPDGAIHYLHRSLKDEPAQPIITLFNILDDPTTLDYYSLRHWRYFDASDLLECPNCRQKVKDPIAACRFAWLYNDLNWLAECPTCRGWSVVTT